MEKLLQTIAYWTPKKLRYFIVIDAWAKTTTGKYSDTVVNELTVSDMVERLEK